MRLRRLLVAVLVPVLALGAGCGDAADRAGLGAGDPPAGRPPAGVPADAQPATVSRHVDGDTIWVEVTDAGGVLEPAADHRVRLLQVDTPEVAGSPQGEECFGPEASAFTARELPLGARVWLEVDTEPTDRFGRHLRYVWTEDGELFNERLIDEGFGEAVLFAPNDARIDAMRAAERRARAARRGLWAAC